MENQEVNLKIVKFTPGMELNVDNFDCGRPELDEFLKKHLGRQHERNVLKAYLLVTDEPYPEVLGYYTLSGGSYAKSSMTRKYKDDVPYRDTSCITLGRLAVDKRIAGKGFGTQLVVDALKVAYAAADTVGIYAVMVEAKDEQVAEFYKKLGFIRLKTEADEIKFFLPTESIKPLL